MSPLLLTAAIVIGLALAGGTVYALVGMRRSRALDRLAVGAPLSLDDDVVQVDDSELPEHRSFLRRWLARAGYRNPLAPAIFVLWTIAAFALGIVLAVLTSAFGIFHKLTLQLLDAPGNFAEIFAPILGVGPVLLLVIMTVIPFLHVRRRRRAIVAAVERELPLVLELLATLAQSGLGFDSAVARISAEEHGVPNVAAEFAVFQRETLSGVPRIRCLRRMAERLDVPTFSTFISSLVHAERSGFGLGDVLRHQAEDLRNRRRENALMRAQALPVKLVFPLVICFLPALFVLTLGPAFYTFAQLTDSVTRTIK